MKILSILLQMTAAEAVSEPTEIRLSLWDLAVQGGWIMVVLGIFPS